jgi:hypothetical protein
MIYNSYMDNDEDCVCPVTGECLTDQEFDAESLPNEALLVASESFGFDTPAYVREDFEAYYLDSPDEDGDPCVDAFIEKLQKDFENDDKMVCIEICGPFNTMSVIHVYYLGELKLN